MSTKMCSVNSPIILICVVCSPKHKSPHGRIFVLQMFSMACGRMDFPKDAISMAIEGIWTLINLSHLVHVDCSIANGVFSNNFALNSAAVVSHLIIVIPPCSYRLFFFVTFKIIEARLE